LLISLLFLFLRSSDHRAPHSFPTRRSSDLSAYYYFAGSLHELDTQTYVPGEARDAITVGPGGSFSVEFALGLGCTHHDGGSTVRSESTRLNSSHVKISYAVFCLKKKNKMIG